MLQGRTGDGAVAQWVKASVAQTDNNTPRIHVEELHKTAL